LCGGSGAATLFATISGDGVRHNRPSETSGTDNSWLPYGARSFLFCLLQRIGAKLRLILIAVFGAIGTLARYGLQGLVHARTGGTFPYGTLLVNLSGCFLLGLIGQFTLNRMVIPADWRVAIAVGFFGGYTTFSSFGWETAKMLEDGEWLPATTYVAASVVAGLLLSVAGIRLANRF
jgi:CrcB protein